jgi:hypothetical protein
MQLTVEKIKNGAKQLSKEELKEVKFLVDSLLENEEKKPKMTEEEFEQHLYEKGIIGKPPPPITDFSRYENYERVEVKGKPVSETIIEERR